MTNNRTYFPTAIDALLALEHGFELIDCNKDHVISDIMFEARKEMVVFDRFYPTPETAHLLEPMAGDLVKVNGGHLHYLIDVVSTINEDGYLSFEHYGREYLEYDYELPEERRVKGFTIIQRNGKPFPATATEE